MRKTGVLVFLIFFILASSVFALSKYYSPIVSGQNIDNEDGFAGASVLHNDLILGTPGSSSHRATFNTCIFAGSGDSDYRYANVDEDGLIYLTDDDFINIFDDDCVLIATHTINGTLQSQPFIFDPEGDGFQNIYYISAISNRNQLNKFEFVNGQIILIDSVGILNQPSGNYHCRGLYCDRELSLGTCATDCNDDSSNVGFMAILDVVPDLTVITNVSYNARNAFDWFDTKVYDEVNDIISLTDSTDKFNVFDRTFPALYGMDIDQDNNIEVIVVSPCDTNDLCFSNVDLTSRSLDDFGLLVGNIFTPNANVFSSGGLSQAANFGSLNSNGEMFIALSGYRGDSPISQTFNYAAVFNSVGSILKTIIDTNQDNFTFLNKKISNFAVSQVDGDLKNDYCIAFNDTARDNETKIHCYSGLTSSIMTNCTFSGWESNTPIHLSLLDWDTTSAMRSEAITTFGIFDLSENSGGECTNLRPAGFAGLTSASEGVMLPVAVGGDFISGSGDTDVDLLYYGADGARLFKTDNIQGETGDPSGTAFCGFAHALLCDDFDYNAPFTSREWRVFTGQSFNGTATPTDNRMFFNNIQRISIEHTIAITDIVAYRVDEREVIAKSDKHPVVSHEFTLNKTSNKTELQYRVFDGNFNPSIDVLFKGNTTYFWNITTGDYQALCIDCLSPLNSTSRIKITQFFGADTFAEFPPAFFPFNVSAQNSHYEVWVNDEMIGDNLLSKDVRSFNAKEVFFIKGSGFDDTRGFHIDDYFVYRGTAKDVDTSDIFTIVIFTNTSTSCITESNTCAATSECCSSLTCVNNECLSRASELVTDTDDNAIRQAFREIPTGNLGFDLIWYLIMFVVGISVFVGVAKTAGGSAALGGTLIVEIFLLIMGTVLGFVPAAIVITIIVVGLVIAGLFLRKMTTGSAN